MLNRIIKKKFYRSLDFSNISAIITLSVTIIFIVFFIPFNNPDYIAYHKLFVFADNYNDIGFGMLYFFTSILGFLNNYIDYETFRFLLSFLQICGFKYVFQKLKFSIFNLSFFTSLPFASFLLIKVHVQIREAIGILFWLICLIELERMKKISIKSIFLFFISFAIHTSTLILWVPTFLSLHSNFNKKLKSLLIGIFFIFIAIYCLQTNLRISIIEYLYGFKNIIIDQNFEKLYGLKNITIDPNFEKLNLSLIKFIYRIYHYFLVLAILIDEKKNRSHIIFTGLKQNIISIFGIIGLNGLLYFLPTVFIIGLIKDVTSADYNLIYRVTLNLFFLLSFYRSFVFPKSFLTTMLNLTLAINVSRQLFFP